MTHETPLSLSLLKMRAFVLSAIVVLVPSVALGQDESPAASEAVPAATDEVAVASGEATERLLASLPQQLAGVPIDPANVSVLSGEEIAQGSETLQQQYLAVEEATGVAIADMALLNSYVQTPEDDLVFLGALLVPGADAALARDVVVALASEDGAGTTEEAELAGLEVTLFIEDGLAGATTYMYPAGDILWLVLGPEDAAAEALTYVSG